MYDDEVPFHGITVGQQYQYEESWHLAAIVTVLEDQCGASLCDDGMRGEAWIGYNLRVDEIIYGNREVGWEFECGFDSEHGQAYKSWKIKRVGSMTDYVVGRVGMGEHE